MKFSPHRGQNSRSPNFMLTSHFCDATWYFKRERKLDRPEFVGSNRNKHAPRGATNISALALLLWIPTSAYQSIF